jgi:L,D-transpeptidase-like protein
VDATDSWFHNPVVEGGRWPAASNGAAGLATSVRRHPQWAALLGLAFSCLTSVATAQGADVKLPVKDSNMDDSAEVLFKSPADSLEWERARSMASKGSGLRVVVSLRERRVWVLRDADTLHVARAAVASGMTINFAGKSWTFRTPRGRHTVLRKIDKPVWRPPDWLYAETAMEYGLELARLRPERPVRVNSDQLLMVRDGKVGLLDESTRRFSQLPIDEHIVFNDTLYIPPFLTQNRTIKGELGRYALDLGDGYLIHGTADPKSIGRAVTHGCIRLGDYDIAWLYQMVPTGTVVHIY